MLSKKLLNLPNQNQLQFSSIFRQFLLLNRSTMISAFGIASISTTSPSQPKAGGQGNSFTTATMSRNGSNTNQLDQCELTMSQCSYLLYFKWIFWMQSFHIISSIWACVDLFALDVLITFTCKIGVSKVSKSPDDDAIKLNQRQRMVACLTPNCFTIRLDYIMFRLYKLP